MPDPTHLHLPTYQLYLYIHVLTYRVSPSNNFMGGDKLSRVNIILCLPEQNNM